MLSIFDTKNKLAQICNGTKVKKVVIFGSYAKGTATPGSDIDLYLVSDGTITGFDFYDLKAKIEDAFNTEIDLILGTWT
ncbi:MAG: nucleotidyltransferase family protein [Clostridia bacterium]